MNLPSNLHILLSVALLVFPLALMAGHWRRRRR